MTTLLEQPAKRKRKSRYAPADQCSPLMSESATRIADWILIRSNARRKAGLGDGSFYRRYMHITGLAVRKYPLPLSTTPKFRTDSPRHEIPRR